MTCRRQRCKNKENKTTARLKLLPVMGFPFNPIAPRVRSVASTSVQLALYWETSSPAERWRPYMLHLATYCLQLSGYTVSKSVPRQLDRPLTIVKPYKKPTVKLVLFNMGLSEDKFQVYKKRVLRV